MQIPLVKKRKLATKLFLVFLLVVFLFGSIYWGIGFLPGHGLKPHNIEMQYMDYLYFSVVTITTLGYGDLTPEGFSRLIVAIESIFGLCFVGFAISQIVSAKQEVLIEYLASNRIFQSYTECIARVVDAKELIGDRRRGIQLKIPTNENEFVFNRSNPFYPALQAMSSLNGYTEHIVDIGKTDELSEHVERAAHHVEELASFTKKYIRLLNTKSIEWKKDRTKLIIKRLCESIESFNTRFVIYTKYNTVPYKGSAVYQEVINSLISEIKMATL